MECCAGCGAISPLLSPFGAGQAALITAAETIGDPIHKIKGRVPDGHQPKEPRLQGISQSWCNGEQTL